MFDWEQALSNEGFRITKPRKVVMDILSQAPSPLNPQQIYLLAKKQDEQVGAVTVYRALELFASKGFIRKVHLEDGCHGYVLASPGHHHSVVCRVCDQAVEFPGDEDLTELVERVQKATGYQVEDHLLQLVGLCPRCAAARSVNSRK